jgi:hypothetical protein
MQRRVLGSSYLDQRREGGFLRNEEIYRDGEGATAHGKGRHTRARQPTLIAVSFHRLFLSGLLPSRARLRFAGLLYLSVI